MTAHPTVMVRDARAADVPLAQAMMAELGYPQADGPAFSTTFLQVLANPGMRILVAEVDGVPAGLATLSARPQPRLAGVVVSVDELVVSGTHRGGGVGTALLDETVRFAESVGARRVELHTRRSRESFARGFYAARGFVEVDAAVMHRRVPTA